jgi:energy-coupling factor transporter ATP-binding protein EcfA2
LLREVIHLLIVGETNAGKSTHARALLGILTQMGVDCCIVDPHAKFNDWGGEGIRIIGAGRNWEEINRFFIAWEGELDRRYLPDEEVGRPLYVFIDEYPTINANCDDASRVFKTQAREGRKPDMHAIFLVQESTVEALGIQGEGTVRNNFTRLLLGRYAVQASKLAEYSDYPAALDHRGRTVALDSSGIEILTRLEVIPERIWLPPGFLNNNQIDAARRSIAGAPRYRISLAPERRTQ